MVKDIEGKPNKRRAEKVSRIGFWLVGILAALCLPALANAQFDTETPSAPGRLSLGVSGGLFRISYDEFDAYYKSRSGFVYGAHGSLRIKSPYHLVVKYRQFNKTGTFSFQRREYGLEWRERWINIGLRYMGLDRNVISNYFSFGFAFFNIQENRGISVFTGPPPLTEPKITTAGGFFIDFGLHYPLSQWMAVNFDVELTSAGPKGKSGFEGTSVGGFFFGIGLVVFLL